jgi:hypothetical protein
MKIVEGWWVMMVRGAQLFGAASHLGSSPMEVRWVAPPRLVALVLGFVVFRFSVVTPQQVAAAVELAQMLRLAVARRARLPADLAAGDLMAASQ